MRCKACNVILSREAMAKKDLDGNFVDLCGECHHVSNETIRENMFVDELRADVGGFGVDPEAVYNEVLDKLVERQRASDDLFGATQALQKGEKQWPLFNELVAEGMNPFLAAEELLGISLMPCGHGRDEFLED